MSAARIWEGRIRNNTALGNCIFSVEEMNFGGPESVTRRRQWPPSSLAAATPPEPDAVIGF